jgi:hypothetical protein
MVGLKDASVGANDYVYEKVTSYDEVFKVGY